jgi:hypothetical protein
MHVTGASARPPCLNIEIVHRRAGEHDRGDLRQPQSDAISRGLRCLKPPGCGCRPCNASGGLGLRPRVFALPWALGLWQPSDAASVPRRSVARRIRSSRSGLARACHRGHVVLAWIDGYIVFLSEVVQNAVITSFSQTEFYNEGTKLWHCLLCYCVKQAASFIRRNISDGN